MRAKVAFGGRTAPAVAAARVGGEAAATAAWLCGKTGTAIRGYAASMIEAGSEAPSVGFGLEVESHDGKTTSSGSLALRISRLAMRGLLISDRSIPPGV